MLSLKCYTREEAVILACAELSAMFEIQTLHYYIKVFIHSLLGHLMYGGLFTELEMFNKSLLRVMD